MGNTCLTGLGPRPQTRPPKGHQGNETTNPDDLPKYDSATHIEQMQMYHRERMKRELQNNLEAFILDQILMCVQFFNHFEKSTEEANEFRRQTEKEMTELLGKDSREGMILGDRRVKLLTGMSEILGRNYIYRGGNHPEDDVDALYGGVGCKDTFIAEGILPLEFVTSWVNFELYHPKELEQVEVTDYSDPKGASPSARFCMEQPDKNIEYPKGYVRLRCVDEPISHRKQLEIPSRPSSDFGYAVTEPVYSKPYGDEIPEAHSESEGTAPSSGTTSDEDTNMAKMMEKLKSTSSLKSQRLDRIADPSASRILKPTLPKLHVAKPLSKRTESFPDFIVHAPTPPVLDGQRQAPPFENGFLFPHSHPNRILNRQSTSLTNIANRVSPGKDSPSSGYDSTSTRSPNSSMVSEMQRGRWQRQNVKKLWEFGRKSRKEQISQAGRYDPTPPDCYSEIKYEFPLNASEDEDDEEDVPEDDNESESDDQEIDFSTGRLRRIRNRNVDEDYEMRFYLNSNAFSSNACSEFHYIGPMLSIPETSMESGVVVGTTMRFPIPYAYPRDNETEDESTLGHYYITYTFTPALHIKTWPDNLYLHFNLQVNNAVGKRWPSQYQMEQMQILGCNAIPLGYRSVEFFNPEQMLEWELNFQECEINLLDSFHSAHWRAYIFASILFRAFIAPLGPQGVGLEHIRNVVYCMCFDDFYGWNDEQPGLHLKTLIELLFECLSKEHMPSFFIRSRNLLQSIPSRSIRFVQAHLHQIRENLVIRCMYAFRNLVHVKKAEDSYPLPDFKQLFNLLTANETELFQLVIPGMRLLKEKEDEEKRDRQRQKSRTRRTKRPHQTILEQQDAIDRKFEQSQREIINRSIGRRPRRDRMQDRLRRGYRNHEKNRQAEQQERDREARRLEEDPEHRLPDAEKRHSIDLRKEPTWKQPFPSLRIFHIIRFFINHFLKMASKAAEFRHYSQATMYVLHVENLCEIVKEQNDHRNFSMTFDINDYDDYRKETLRLRGEIGKDIDQYILARSAFPSTEYGQPPSSSKYPSEPASGPFPSFTNNWDLRKLPTPPTSVGPSSSGKKLEKPNIVSSLQSLDSFSNSRMSPNVNTPPPPSPRVPIDRYSPRRQESIKFVDPTPPSTPPRARSPRKMSTFSMSLGYDDEGDEGSTDL